MKPNVFRSMKSRWLLVVAATMLLASACTFGEGDSDEGGNGDGGAGGSVELTIWAHRSPSFNEAIRDAARLYEADHPGTVITLETFTYDEYIQTLQTALPAGNAPDILHMFGTWACTYTDFLRPVPEEVISLADAQERFFPGPLGGYTCDDTLYGLPQESNVEYGAILVNTADGRCGRHQHRGVGELGRAHRGRPGPDRDPGRRDDARGLPLHRR